MTISDMFGRQMPMLVYMDSKSLYDSLTGINTTTENRILNDLAVLRHAYELRDISKVVLVSTKDNPADALTKDSPSPVLMRWMLTNELTISAKSCGDRKVKTYTDSNKQNAECSGL